MFGWLRRRMRIRTTRWLHDHCWRKTARRLHEVFCQHVVQQPISSSGGTCFSCDKSLLLGLETLAMPLVKGAELLAAIRSAEAQAQEEFPRANVGYQVLCYWADPSCEVCGGAGMDKSAAEAGMAIECMCRQTELLFETVLEGRG